MAIQDLFDKFQEYGRAHSISETILENIRAHSVLIAHDLEVTKTYDKRVGQLFRFMKENPEVCIVSVDKSIDVAIMLKHDYEQKLSKIFDNNSNFEKIKEFKLEETLESFRKIFTENLGKSFNSRTLTYLLPNYTTSISYWMIKLHKEDLGLRPITTGYNAICSNAQKFLKRFVEPSLTECTYLVDSPSKAKQRLLADISKFDPKIHTIVSFDATKLYTNVKTTRVLSPVLDTMYKSPDIYFLEKDEFGKRLPIPSRSNFRIFMQNVLKNYNIFENNLGYYRQIGGLAMGSPLSGALSNVFIHLMEKQ